MDGAADARVALVTVVPVEGRPEWPLAELPSRGGDLESGAELGIEAVRGGHARGDIGGSSTRSQSASMLFERLRAWIILRLRCCSGASRSS